ncbi:MAG: hypothetical protein ABIH23_29055 [bacterium]
MQRLFPKLSCTLLALSAFLLAGTAWADVEPMVQQKSDGVTFITGGVGADERAELKEQFKEYTCRIELANKMGEYLYKGEVSIRDSEDKDVLKTKTCGPWLLVNLAEGKYTIVVYHKGMTQTLSVAIEKDKKSVFIARF